ncbi:MAG: hypothetical protein AB8B73_09920 [Ekhidna sp.]
MKYLKYILLSLLVLIIGATLFGAWKFNNTFFKERSNRLTYTSEPKPIRFNWANDSIGNIFETQVAMIVPVKLEGLSHKLHMQFDTGSPYSFIYENDLKSLRKVGIHFKEIIKGNTKYIESIELILGGNKVGVSMIMVLKNYGNNFNRNDTLSELNIGTIGSDFMLDRVTEIDFRKQTLQFHNERTEWMRNLSSFQPFDFKGRRLMLPTTINGDNIELFYDSGCSAFGLITTKNRFDNYTDKDSETIAYDANSWGSDIPIIHKTTNTKMIIGSANLSLKRVSYIDMYASTQRLATPFTRIGGWLGNQPLNQSVLILDTQKEEFVVIENTEKK